MQKKKLKFTKVDFIIILLCLTGALFSGIAFWREYAKILVKMNEEPVGTIIFKKNTAQRRFIDRGIWDRLQRTTPVYNGDTIRTTEQSEAIIIFDDAVTLLNMDESTMIQVFYSGQKGAAIDFSGGNMEVISESKNITISSGTSTIVIDGQARMNKNEEEFILSVSDGTASFDGTEIEAGNILALDSDGAISTRPIISMTSFGSSVQILNSSPNESASAFPVVFSWNSINFSPDTFVVLEVAADRGFSDTIAKMDVRETSSAVIPLENGTYWWRAYPANTVSHEPTRRFYPSGTLEVIPFIAAVPISPNNASELVFRGETSVPFSWSTVENASAYLLEIASRPDMSAPAVSRWVEENSITQTGLDYGHWFWRITPVFPSRIKGTAAPSTVNEFSIIQGLPTLAAPVLTFPPQNGQLQPDSSGLRLMWSFDRNATSWLVELADNQGMINPAVTQPSARNFFPLPPELLQEGKTWYWRVSALGGESPSVSATWNFETISDVQKVPVIAVPSLPPIIFGTDTAETIAGNEQALSHIAQTLSTLSEYRLRIEGHANPTADPADTAARLREQDTELKPLSEMRARAIADHLAALGIDRSRLELYGFGGSRPIAAWEDRDNWWKNRRVEFVLTR